jgi:hypothetical protein
MKKFDEKLKKNIGVLAVLGILLLLVSLPMTTADHSSDYALDADDGSPTHIVYVDSAGEVGVGTTTPSGPLHVYSSGGIGTNTLIIEQNNQGNADTVMIFRNEGGELSRITADESADTLILASAVGSEIMIDNDNQVGIMERTPVTTLDVDGGFATHVYYVSGTPSYTATNSDFTILVNPQSPLGTTVTLPTAVGIDGQIYIIKNAYSAGGTMPVYIQTYSTQTIDAYSSITLGAVWEVIQIQAYNGNWYILSHDTP